MVRQRDDVVAPIGQARQIDRDDLQPVIEILAKGTFGNGVFQIAIRCRQHANINANGFVLAHAHDFAALQHSKKLDLSRHRHVADFVQEECTAVGVFESADSVGLGVGVGAPYMSEQFALE